MILLQASRPPHMTVTSDVLPQPGRQCWGLPVYSTLPQSYNDGDCADGFSGLSLGAPAASSAPLFGTGFSLSASSAAPAASPFGAHSASSAASVFGSQLASSAASVFGALPASSAASLFANSPGGSLFSQPSSAPVFGQQASAPGGALYSAHIQHGRVRSSWQS